MERRQIRRRLPYVELRLLQFPDMDRLKCRFPKRNKKPNPCFLLQLKWIPLAQFVVRKTKARRTNRIDVSSTPRQNRVNDFCCQSKEIRDRLFPLLCFWRMGVKRVVPAYLTALAVFAWPQSSLADSVTITTQEWPLYSSEILPKGGRTTTEVVRQAFAAAEKKSTVRSCRGSTPFRWRRTTRPRSLITPGIIAVM